MKKVLFALMATLTLSVFTTASASYTGNVSDYYNQNKSDYTLNVGELGNITVTQPVYSVNVAGEKQVQYNQDKVICKYSTNMCYSAADALRAFGLDVEAFTKGYEAVTGNTTNFVNLFKKLYVKPSL